MSDTVPVSSSVRPLKVIIAGGGLAGLLAARVLREKHEVTVYERMSTPQETGAAINIGPNDVGLLQTLNFDRSKAGSLSVGATKVFNKDGALILDKVSNYAQIYGADWLFHHRADLRAEFLRLATAPSETSGIPGLPAEIKWGIRVVDVDTEECKVMLSTGEEVFADLIIAGDGIKSVIRPLVVGDAAFSTARPSGLSAFRFTPTAEQIEEELGEVPEIIRSDAPVCLSMVYSFDGTMRSVVMYPCRNFGLLNFVAIVPDKSLKQATTESWSAAGDKDEMLSCFKDSLSWVLTYLRTRRAQAVEDAEGFRLFLCDGVAREDVPELLKLFDSVRRPRADQIQSNTKKAHGKRTAEEVYMFEKVNWTYTGIEDQFK